MTKTDKTMTEAMAKLDSETRKLRCAHCGKYPFPSSKEEMNEPTQLEEIIAMVEGMKYKDDYLTEEQRVNNLALKKLIEQLNLMKGEK